MLFKSVIIFAIAGTLVLAVPLLNIEGRATDVLMMKRRALSRPQESRTMKSSSVVQPPSVSL
ncbi:hypothetical protein EXIGLDRAFT_725810 [Exidia glandulosa HHB12029]|uniref:Uncharacterized protein n=1 Tax=Exidia glandulosa HHB12029 TaxID=1314781 RepID=A0A165QBK4_EXIGL|nr:hypothetical protein EXIGLDRAFT_725810 [Exidia glandulosa HHB12029]